MAHKWARWLHNPCRRVPTASHLGRESRVADKWAQWLHDPCHQGGPHRFRARGSIRGGPQMGKVTTSRLPPGHRQRFSASAKSQVAHPWVRWLHKPCHLGVPTA